MSNLNKVFLIGNLTKDPELRYIPSGQAVATFTMAINRTYKDSSGDKKEDATFIKIVTWARLAEICNEYLKKGQPVFVEGRIQTRSWDGPDGQKRYATEVVAENVQFLGTKSGTSKPSDPEEKPLSDKAKAAGFTQDDLKPDEEIPF